MGSRVELFELIRRDRNREGLSIRVLPSACAPPAQVTESDADSSAVHSLEDSEAERVDRARRV
jgi:hypothetical protein